MSIPYDEVNKLTVVLVGVTSNKSEAILINADSLLTIRIATKLKVTTLLGFKVVDFGKYIAVNKQMSAYI